MAHIQRGDDRQYLTQGSAELDNLGQMAGLLNQGLQTGVSITQKANESTMASNQIDLSTRFLAENNKINTKYQADPTNPQREVELQQAFESLANQYKINPVCQKQWSDIKTNVYDRYKVYNAQWVEKQQQSNISTNLKNGYEGLINQISMLGESGASIDEMRLIYANGIEGLRNGAVAGLGEVVVDNFLKDANHDVMTSYISALALNNPLEAQALLKDKGVRNDIGRAETLQKLDDYVANAITEKNKKFAIDELGNALRAMNSKEANDILDGNVDLSKVMNFAKTHKGLPQKSIEVINSIYGIQTRQPYYYDPVKKEITKKEEGHGSGSSDRLRAIKKMSKVEKDGLAQQLEADLCDLFFFEDTPKVNVKKVNKNKQGQAVQNDVISRMQTVAQAQGAIDTAWDAGVITKAQRQNLMNKYIEPMSNYLEANMQDLDERKGLWGSKLGYNRLKEAFSTKNIPANHTREIRHQEEMMFSAQSRYYKNLDDARKKYNLNSIYELETLDKKLQEETYKNASEEAINYVKKYGEHPEIFYKKEYAQYYEKGLRYFGIEDGNKVAKEVAKRIYGAEDISKVDVDKVVTDEMMKQYSVNKIRAGETYKNTLDYFGDSKIQKPKSYEEYVSRIQKLGLTQKEFEYDVHKRGLVRRTSNSVMDYFPALVVLEQAVEDKKRMKK